MKIYVLEDYYTKCTVCVSEDIHMIRKYICNKEYFTPGNNYPILKIWKNGVEIESVEGDEVLKKIAKEMYGK